MSINIPFDDESLHAPSNIHWKAVNPQPNAKHQDVASVIIYISCDCERKVVDERWATDSLNNWADESDSRCHVYQAQLSNHFGIY